MLDKLLSYYSPEMGYVGLIFVIFVIPKYFQRFRIPSAITSLALGVFAASVFHLYHEDEVIQLLSTLGIVSLFLYAGLEVNVAEIRSNSRILGQHLVLLALFLAGGTAVVALALGLPLRTACLVSLALGTPSTGFIIDSLDIFKLSEQEKRWIKSKAIAGELLALAVLFVVMQSSALPLFLISVATLAVMVFVMPVVFKLFVSVIVPYAPKSETAFLIMLAVVCAFVTRELGVYYLVGAFVVGVAARQLREQIPAVASEKVLDAIEVFASFFVPFYFFHAGAGLDVGAMNGSAWIAAGVFLLVVAPFRIVSVTVHRIAALKEQIAQGLRIAVPMLPTLVFTLVIAGILRDRFAVDSYIYGGLVIYAVLNTLLPTLLLRTPPPDYTELPVSEIGKKD